MGIWYWAVRGLGAVLLAALAGGSPARAAIDFTPCGHGIECGRLSVPLDRAGRAPGTISLFVQRVRSPHPSPSEALVALQGGPGQTNTNFTRDAAQFLAPALKTRDLIVFDQRGTGSSGAIRCPGIESGAPPAQALPACASQLGAAAHSYTTVDSAQDIEALRQALGVDKLDLFGTSYGTWVEQIYARLYPAHVGRLVLDSTVSPLLQDDGLQVDEFKELPQAVRAECAHGACRGLTRDLWADGVRLYRRLGAHPIHTSVFDAHGRRRPMTIDQVGFALLVPDLDIHAERRAEIPRAIHGALHGDPALLARLIALSGPSGPDPKRDVNQTLDQVTQCEERGMPFDRTASPEQKLAQAQAALARVPSSVFAPFGPQLAFGVTLVPTCAYWPARPQRPDFGGSLPHVPALLLHGVADQRTTPGETAEIAHALPHSVTIDVPYVGHSTWGTDVTGCVKAAVARFLAGGTPARCRATGNPYAPRPLPPRSLGAVRGGLRAAVAASVDDAFAQLDYLILRRTALLPTERFGGLRGGSAHGTARGLVLDRYSYIRGLEVSGLVPRHGPVRLRANGLLLRNLHVRRETLYEELHARGLLPG